MDANEPPIGDGSALMLCRGDPAKPAWCRWKRRRLLFHVREPISIETKSGSLLVLLPDDEFRISCTQAGPENRFTQFMSTAITPAIYEREIAPARTFVYYEDVQALMEKNLIKGGSLENAIVVRGRVRPEQGAAPFPDEIR